MTYEDAARWFQSSPNAYMVLDRELRYIAANPTYLALTGSTEDELLGTRIFDRFPNDPSDPNNEPRQLLEASLRKVLRTGEKDVLAFIPYRVAREPSAEPELRVWSATHVPLRGPEGEVHAVLQHTEDITRLADEPSRVANVLSRAEQVQRAYVELGAFIQTVNQAPGFMAFLRGPDHVFEYCNRAYETLVGDRPLLRRTVRDALPELARRGLVDTLDQVFETKEPYVGRSVLVPLDPPAGPARQVYLDFVYQPVLGPEQEVHGILVQGQDVTELVRGRNRDRFRARASERLAAAGEDIGAALEQIAAAAVESLADWAFIDRFDGEISRRLVAHADPEHAASAEVLRRSVLEFPLPAGHLLLGIDRGPLLHSVVDPGRDDLRPLQPSSLVAVPLSHGGHLHGVLVLVSTGAHFHYDEDDLSALVELGRVVGTVLENAQLSAERRALLQTTERALAQANAASRAKDDFLALLGHELRNPLAPILGAVDVMRQDPAAPLERMLHVVERQARHLTRLVDDMLDVSRIVHGKLELRHDAVPVDACVAKAVEMAMVSIENKEHRLEVAPIPPGSCVFGDEARIAQVLANLLVNAARYTEPGGRISLRTTVDDTRVTFTVRDSGIGMDPMLLARIFEPFVQAPQDSHRTDGGLGLGLNLVQQLVQLHGGTVSAASEGEGRGSTFTVVLPRHDPPAATDQPDSEPRPNTPKLRVMVVDDNVDATEMLALLLGAAGHEVERADNGRTGLERLTANPPDVAIVDLGLPEIDGLELSRRLHAVLGDRTPPLIALTGYGSADDRARSADAGFSVHLTKPVDIDELLGLVQELGDGARA